ncbi:hypothetical protein OGM63_21945 [Plectonema radiosum NIES-515]|uniref:Uncharacterized protein n=1 Tax=Plectonema radiosum NIES-515 TaxID=2986073 RepID=A0ABT3B461_9CYAN|nr:hypothetical protein [Plectonema radiosum]MCV3216139.1 hypothetical protein [Plectonema radiosum NIES-515]
MIKTKVTQPMLIATIATIIAIASFPNLIFSALPTAKIVAQEVEPIKKSPDQVIRWNAIALEIIKAEKTSAPMAAHNLAMVHAAVYDAVNAISPTYQPYQVKQKAPAKTSK